MNIQNKIIFSILSLILFFGILASVTTYYLTRKEFTGQLTNNLINNTFSQSQEVYQILRQSRDLSIMLANRPAVREYFTNPKNVLIKEQVEDHYLDGLNLGNMYSAIYLLDTGGTGLVSTDPTFVGKNYNFRNYFTQAKNGNVYTEVALGITSNELGYYFSSPVFSLKNEKEVIGITVFKLNPKYIESALLEHIKPGYNIILTDQNGIVIIASNPNKLFSSLGTLPTKIREELEQKNTYGTGNFPELDYDLLMQEIISKNDTPKITKIIDKIDNHEEIVSIAKIRDFPLYLIFEGNLIEITKISINSSLIIAAFVGAAAIASIIIIIFVVKIFLRQQQKTEEEIIKRTAEIEKLNSLMVGRELRMIELKQKIAQIEGNK